MCTSLFQFAAKFQSILRAHVGHVACCSCSCRCCRPVYQSVLSFVLPYILWSLSLENGKGNSKIYPCACVCVLQLFYMLLPNRTMRLLTVFQRCRMNRTQRIAASRGLCLKICQAVSGLQSRVSTEICTYVYMYVLCPGKWNCILGYTLQLYPAVIAVLGI